jgi:hypothetical protein
VLPEDDMRYAIETCRSSLSVFSVNNFRLIYDIQLVHMLVCNIQWMFKMHGATIKIHHDDNIYGDDGLKNDIQFY